MRKDDGEYYCGGCDALIILDDFVPKADLLKLIKELQLVEIDAHEITAERIKKVRVAAEKLLGVK